MLLLISCKEGDIAATSDTTFSNATRNQFTTQIFAKFAELQSQSFVINSEFSSNYSPNLSGSYFFIVGGKRYDFKYTQCFNIIGPGGGIPILVANNDREINLNEDVSDLKELLYIIPNFENNARELYYESASLFISSQENLNIVDAAGGIGVSFENISAISYSIITDELKTIRISGELYCR